MIGNFIRVVRDNMKQRWNSEPLPGSVTGKRVFVRAIDPYSWHDWEQVATVMPDGRPCFDAEFVKYCPVAYGYLFGAVSGRSSSGTFTDDEGSTYWWVQADESPKQ